MLITAIGVSLFLQNIGQLKWVFGTQPQHMPALIHDHALFDRSPGSTSGSSTSPWSCSPLVLLFALECLVYRTKLGRAMRAVSFDERVASLMGINVNRVVSITFAIGSALAAAGGLLFALKYEGMQADRRRDLGAARAQGVRRRGGRRHRQRARRGGRRRC